MQFKSVYLLFPFIGSIILALGSMPEPRNPPLGNSGAPGETSCMLSSCHTGGNYNGTVTLSGLPDTVIADQTYDVSVINQSNAVRSGFQLTVLDTSNKFTGTLIKGTGVNIAKDIGTGKTYARQEFAINFVNGQASWNFQWKAPSGLSSDEIIFYFASMCANGDGDRTKDNSLKNSKRVIFQLPVSTSDVKSKFSNPILFYAGNHLYVKDPHHRMIENLSVSNLNGLRVFELKSNTLGTIKLLDGLHGIHIVNYKLGKEYYSEKIWIP